MFLRVLLQGMVLLLSITAHMQGLDIGRQMHTRKMSIKERLKIFILLCFNKEAMFR